VLASYGQSYKIRVGIDTVTRWWKATTTQMKYAYNLCINRGCPSVSWWSLDYLLGRAGHELPKEPEPLMIKMIRSFAPIAPPPPPPDPTDPLYPERLRTQIQYLRSAATNIENIAGEIEGEGE
jgi:hypothetical protein